MLSKLQSSQDLHSFLVSGPVGNNQQSPTRDSHRGSPLTLDENKSRQSPGMADNQNGQSRNMFALQEDEEVSRGSSLKLSEFSNWRFCFRRSDNSSSSPSLSAISSRQHPPAGCPRGSGLAVPTSKTCARCSLRPHYTSTRPPSTRRTTNSTIGSSRRRSSIR